MARLHVSLLGPFAVTLDERPVEGFESAKVRGLLAYLAVERDRPHGRERLAELFWPEQPAGAALGNLRHVLANLRQVLGDRSATSPFLLVSADTIQLNPAADILVDIVELACFTAEAASTPPTVEACRAAVALYRGPFLQDFALDDSPDFEEWAIVVREQAERRLAPALAHLAGHSLACGEYAQAVEWTRRQVALEPWNEELHCQLMGLLALDGRRAAALRQFVACRKLLTKELGVEPQPKTLALVERIRLGQVERSDLVEFEGKTLRLPQAPAAQAVIRGLPAPQTPFYGRDVELACIARDLADPACRLLTIVGPGGIGKTRLAIQAAQAQIGNFVHGVVYVPLVAVQREYWVSAVHHALSVPTQGAAEPWRRLLDFLKDKALLLVLDNFEHLEDEAGRIAELSAAAPQVKLLVTSRVRLNLSAEWLLPLDGLEAPPLPAAAAPGPEMALASSFAEDWQQVEGYSSLQLLLHSIRRLQPDFVLTPADAAAAAALCRLLDGIPLAIELAATWVRFLGLSAVPAQVQHNLDLLATTVRDVPERHRSMRVVFDTSWQLLSPREQQLLGRMAVFRGGCTTAAAQAVTGASLVELAALVDKSWLHGLSSGRWEMHELARQYAEARLADAQAQPEADETADVRRRHCAYYAGLLRARAGGINLRNSVMADILSDFANFLAAWQWAVTVGDMAAVFDMSMTFYYAGDMLGMYRFNLQLFESAIQALSAFANEEKTGVQGWQAAAPVLGWLHYARTWHLIHMGLLEQAQAENERNLAVLNRRAPDDGRTEQSLMIDWADAWLAYYWGRYGEARRRLRLILRRFRLAQINFTLYGPAAGALFWQAHAEAALAKMAWVAGRYRVAQARLRRALTLRDQIGEQRYRAFNLALLARMLLATGDFAQAEETARTGLRLSETFGDQIGVAAGHFVLGSALAALGDYPQAQAHLRQCEAIARQSGEEPLLMESLTALGRMELALGYPDQALCRFEEAKRVFAALGTAHSNALVGVTLGQGWAALAGHDLPAARRLFGQAPGMTGCTAGEALDATAGLAEVCAATGQASEAAALLALVLHSPETYHATRLHATHLVEQLGPALPAPATLYTAKQRLPKPVALIASLQMAGEYAR